jgi:hypothetical protein
MSRTFSLSPKFVNVLRSTACCKSTEPRNWRKGEEDGVTTTPVFQGKSRDLTDICDVWAPLGHYDCHKENLDMWRLVESVIDVGERGSLKCCGKSHDLPLQPHRPRIFSWICFEP